jgi:hypothetical protein
MSASYQETELLGGQTVWQETRADEAIYAITQSAGLVTVAAPLVDLPAPAVVPVPRTTQGVALATRRVNGTPLEVPRPRPRLAPAAPLLGIKGSFVTGLALLAAVGTWLALRA